MILEQTHFGNGYSDGVNGKLRQTEFPTPDHAQKYYTGYEAGRERLNQRFTEQKHYENSYSESQESK